ncbi:uncharacterized protein LOC130980624 [Arachis stenosperma]|uniref:uncharacterized protein LOC130980624 n=1 Tax=Arachis stenosperma TaxID=217475 RepID=UPI0025AC2E53|nr:uncharacterized protein LOC130980624 [Arachis stenosperma]
MILALNRKNKLCFVDDSLPKPQENDPNFMAWEKCNTHGYVFRIAELEEELFSIKQGGLSFTSYIIKLKAVWQELDTFWPIPHCNCGESCTCGLSVVRNYRKDNYLVRFLRGLNEQHVIARSQIMLIKPLPIINDEFALLTQQEQQLNTPDILDSKTILAAQSSFDTSLGFQNLATWGRGRRVRGRGDRFGRPPSKACFYCHKTSHLIDTCYKRYAFPLHLNNNNNNNTTHKQ